MVLLDDLGAGLSDEYVLIKINRDVRFIDEIKMKASNRDEFKLKAWGTAINLAVRLAAIAVEEDIPDFYIDSVQIGTEEDVEMKNNKVRPLSWMEIVIKKK
ncbi:MAG: hypothetical protein ACFFCS_13670 [Candidatus Hodarchaeota archaeon]